MWILKFKNCETLNFEFLRGLIKDSSFWLHCLVQGPAIASGPDSARLNEALAHEGALNSPIARAWLRAMARRNRWSQSRFKIWGGTGAIVDSPGEVGWRALQWRRVAKLERSFRAGEGTGRRSSDCCLWGEVLWMGYHLRVVQEWYFCFRVEANVFGVSVRKPGQ